MHSDKHQPIFRQKPHHITKGTWFEDKGKVLSKALGAVVAVVAQVLHKDYFLTTPNPTVKQIVWSIQMLLLDDLLAKNPLIDVDISNSIDIWINHNTNSNTEHLLTKFLDLAKNNLPAV